MTTSSARKWIVKYKDGVVRGPYGTEQILEKIKAGELTGEEMISLFPHSDWHSISSDPQFYDKLLEFLEGDRIDERESSRRSASRKPEDIDESEDSDDEFAFSKSGSRASKVNEPYTPPPRSRAEKVSSNYEPPPVEEKTESPKQETPEDIEQPVIELKKKKKVVRKAKVKKSLMPVILAGVVILGAAYWVMNDTPLDDDRLHLLAPQKGQAQMAPADVQSRLKEATSYMARDTFTSYLKAQNSLVQAYEGDNKNLAALGFLCMTYYELWPFTYQDSQDFRAVTVATQWASQIDPGSQEASTCRLVDDFIRGRFAEAKSIVETALESNSSGKANPVAFYYFKTQLLDSARERESALNYVRSAQQMWSQWLRLFSLEASILTSQNRFEDAAKRYRQILQANPDHAQALVELGIIEYRHFKNVEQGGKYIYRGLESSEKIKSEVAARGYLALAEIALQKGSKGDALKYARNSYALNSTNPKARQLVLQLGGDKALKNTRVMDLQLVYEGDQLVREGDCSSAQAHYKAAYEVNPKNAWAAIKASECLWKMSLTSESIDWLNKAIRADPQMIDSYILLADFYGRRYNFSAASQVLAKANQIQPRNYKVFRGFALIELRRRNPEGAVNSSDKAIQLYEADVESYIINARAQIALKQFAKAFSSASKATELDINNRDAQIVFAEALVGVQGVTAAVEHLNKLVSVYPLITDYRIALGDLYFRDQSYGSAETVYEQVTRIDPKSKEAFLKLGQARQIQAKYDPALDAYLRAAELDPADVEALVKAGLLYLEIKKPVEGQQQFIRAQKISQDYPLINYYIGRAALLNGVPEQALEEARKEKAKNPNLADPYLLAADAYVEMQKYQLCAGEYQQAVRLRPQGAEIYVKMARCFRLSGNLDAALSMINTAADQESGQAEVYKEQALIYETKGDRIKAIEGYQQYLVLAPNAADRQQVEGRIRSLSQ